MLAQGRIKVDGRIASDIQTIIHQFTHVSFDEQELQAHQPTYVMMNKPCGVVSATKDAQHRTVIDLLQRENRNSLHICGRLDFNSTGLLLLTNDGRWSRQLSSPEERVRKLYRVELNTPITRHCIEAFATGMYFEYEKINTLPAKLSIISDHIAEIGLVEGRYHQIKRMFGRFNIKVLKLHRLAVGNVILDECLLPGQSRDLTAWEVNNIKSPNHGDLNEY